MTAEAPVLGYVVGDGTGIDGFAGGVTASDLLPLADDEDGLLVLLVTELLVVANHLAFAGAAETGKETLVSPVPPSVSQGGQGGGVAARRVE